MKKKMDLNELEKRLDDTLKNESSESLSEFLAEQRKNNRNNPDFIKGMEIGNYIVKNYLPTLNVDMLKSNNVINVSAEEEEKYKQLDKEWFGHSKYFGDNNKELHELSWNTLKEYYKVLKEKYLPKELICSVPEYYFDDKQEFLNGFEFAIWDCDFSNYWTCKDSLVNETTIKLVLD